MTGAGAIRSSAGAVMVLAGVAAFSLGARAGNYDFGSLASEFLQSKTEMTILSHDDLAVPSCADKHVVKASPSGEPAEQSVGSVLERKWTERWTLERCGVEVSYMVFFTVVGNGGAYYAIVDPKPSAVPSGDIQNADSRK
jgi:hypothetical protein